MSNPVPLAARAAADPFEAIDADLDLLAELDPADQVPVFGRVHAALTSALAATAGTTPTGSAPTGSTPSGTTPSGTTPAGSAPGAPARPQGSGPAGAGRTPGPGFQRRGGR